MQVSMTRLLNHKLIESPGPLSIVWEVSTGGTPAVLKLCFDRKEARADLPHVGHAQGVHAASVFMTIAGMYLQFRMHLAQCQSTRSAVHVVNIGTSCNFGADAFVLTAYTLHGGPLTCTICVVSSGGAARETGWRARGCATAEELVMRVQWHGLQCHADPAARQAAPCGRHSLHCLSGEEPALIPCVGKYFAATLVSPIILPPDKGPSRHADVLRLLHCLAALQFGS